MADKILTGIGIGDRHAIGAAYVFTRSLPQVLRQDISDVEAELRRLARAADNARVSLSQVIENVSQTDSGSADILAAQLEFLDDDEYYGVIKKTIHTHQLNAEAAIDTVSKALVEDFLQLEDEYFRERAADIRDMSQRLIADLAGVSLHSLGDISEQVVLVAHDLVPSDTAQLNPEYVLAFCTETGTATSHTALLANSLGIPAVVGCEALTDADKKFSVKDGDLLIVDGKSGAIQVNPSPAELAAARKAVGVEAERDRARLALAHRPAITQDGTQCNVYANIASAAEAKRAIEYGAEGSGLLRTEFFFYNEDALPSAERQFEMYAEVARALGKKPITVRTVDIGGDKPLPALEGWEGLVGNDEQNPFLGVRGIRLTDTAPDLLESQLRALIRTASECAAEIKIMFPFVSVPDEIKRLRETVRALHAQMSKEAAAAGEASATGTATTGTGTATTGKAARLTLPQVGAMIEIPSAALTIEHILPHTDFISIGTNDLTQYTLAADRTNERVSALADYCNPAVIRLVDEVIRAAIKHDTEVSVCGEMAGDPLVIPLLYGMGLTTYSMSAVSIPKAKEHITQLRRADCARLRQQCLRAESTSRVRTLLQKFGT